MEKETFGKIPDWKPPVKRGTIRPELIGNKTKPSKDSEQKKLIRDALETIAEDNHKNIEKDAWMRELKDPNPKN